MVVSANIPSPSGTPLRVGTLESVKVMALIGSTSRADERLEASKIEALAKHVTPPDLVADLSLRRSPFPIWQRLLRAGFPAVTLPIYLTHSENGKIDPGELLDIATEQIESGVGMITIHPTARMDLISLSQRRGTPWTSRGGGLVIRDLMHGRSQNVYLTILPSLSAAARAHGVTISLGATFRSAAIVDADDDAQRAEIAFQTELAIGLKLDGCSVVIEGPGHASPTAIKKVAARMRKGGCPIMPLGPIPTDRATGQDHVSSAIGATLMGLEDAAHILAAVTRNEHTGGVPQISSTLEAVDAARIAAHVVDLARFGTSAEEVAVATQRAARRTCVLSRTRRGCSRCGNACPL